MERCSKESLMQLPKPTLVSSRHLVFCNATSYKPTANGKLSEKPKHSGDTPATKEQRPQEDKSRQVQNRE